MNLLIVDDIPTNLKLLRAQLEAEGHTVCEAPDGVDALALLQRQPVDAVISDILMPRMDGYRLCHEIRKHSRLRDLPILIYTSTYTSPGDEKLAVDVGADKYLTKPTSDETLIAALHEVIAQPHPPMRPGALQEVEVLRQYSERLVHKLEHKNIELMAAEAVFRPLVEQSLVGIYVIQDDRFVYVNPKMTEMLGYSGTELTSRPMLDFIAEQDRPLTSENIRKRLSGEVESVHYELHMLRKDGKMIDAEVQGSRSEFNGRPAILGNMLDITEQKKLEEWFRQAQKMESIGTLAGGIAHDFNNILAAMNGYTELARMDSADNPGVLKHLEAVAQAGQRAVGLVRQILAFSRQQEQERKPIQLRRVVEEALKLLRATIPATIEFKTLLARDVPTVLADATQIHQVVMNLGTNASHAMKDQPGQLEVKLENFDVDADFARLHPGLRPGRHVRLSVADTGSGMDQATLSRIFEPFFTTKAQGEGTGLGLAVVHGIVQSHDGVITVYSQPGEGTTFHLYFPAHAGEESALQSPAASVPRGQGERILFVDDEKPLVELGRKMLEPLGYSVTVASGAEQALAAVRAQPESFDLVVTDLTMPRMTGTDLARQLLQIRPDLPIILCTGFSASLTAERVREMGIRELLMKPHMVGSLGAAVHRVLAGRKTR